MKKQRFFSAALAVLSLTVLSTTGCEQPAGITREEQPAPAVLAGIAISAPPDIIVYAKDEPFDPSGLVVTGSWSDDTERTLTESEYSIDTPDTGVPGPKLVTVRSGAFSDTFRIKVNSSSARLESISLEQPPDVTTLYVGQNLSTAGMVIRGHYSDGSTLTESLYTWSGYDRARRGTRTVTVTVNRKTCGFPVTVRVPAGAEAAANEYQASTSSHRNWYRAAAIRGRAPGPSGLPEDLKITVRANGITAVLSAADGDFSAADLSGYNANQPGPQTLTLTLDEKTVTFPVYVIDVAPHVFFDYGYWRHANNPNGGATLTVPASPQYTIPQGQELIITPVVFAMNTDTPSYSWTCDAPHSTSGPGNKYLKVTPAAEGTYSATVTVNAGSATGMTATAQIVCTPARPAAQPGPVNNPLFSSPLPPVYQPGNTNTGPYIRNFAPGQFTKSGTGYGWSLCSIGGYLVWKLQKPGNGNIQIQGNPFGTWSEAGIVWVSADDNGNGLPDDTWYELRGSDDGNSYASQITRPYGIRFVLASVSGYVNEFLQTIQPVYWVDSKGRTGMLPGGWPADWGAPEADHAWVEFGATLLRDDGRIDTGDYNGLNFDWGYVDSMNTGAAATGRGTDRFRVSDAIRADGSQANLPWTDFVRVQTGVFRYAGIFGDVSTEIKWAEGLGSMSDFPDPN